MKKKMTPQEMLEDIVFHSKESDNYKMKNVKRADHHAKIVISYNKYLDDNLHLVQELIDLCFASDDPYYLMKGMVWGFAFGIKLERSFELMEMFLATRQYGYLHLGANIKRLTMTHHGHAKLFPKQKNFATYAPDWRITKKALTSPFDENGKPKNEQE